MKKFLLSFVALAALVGSVSTAEAQDGYHHHHRHCHYTRHHHRVCR